MKYIFGIILLLLNINSYAQGGVKKEDWSKVKEQDFDSLLTDLNINFSIPENFSETDLVENNNVLYQKAYSHDSSGFEIRIWIRDIRNKKTLGGLSPDQFSKSYLTMLSMNASGYVLPNMPQITVFDKNTSKSEFNADWIASTVFLPNKNAFNSGYEVCSIIGMRKNELAEVYVFFMVSDREKQKHLVRDLVQVVTFK
ncbi:MAG: hypothetical protein H6584_02575 [Flavobacteriales bacterium]|nr:hypothetical protein [Flavobacteriales bacterium]